MTSDFPLFPKHIHLFIGGRDKNTGNFIPHISPGMSPESMRNFVAETFDLVPVDDQNETPSQLLSLDMEKVLHGVVNHFLEGIRAENLYVFKSFVQYDEGGIFRSFAKFYNRIRKGKFQPPAELQIGLNRLYAHYQKVFNDTQDFIINSSNQSVSNTKLSENFSVLVNVLLMSILCDFHADPEDFQEETILRDDIRNIKNRITQFLMHPPHASSDIYYQFVLQKRLFAPDQYARIERITGEILTDADALNSLKNRMICDKDFYGNDKLHFDKGWGYKKYNIELSVSLDSHFDALLNMLGLINMVESVYQDYKAKSFGNNSNPDVAPVQYQLLLNKLSNS